MRKIILLLFLIPSLCFAGLRGSELTVLGDNKNSCFIPKAGILPQESYIKAFWQMEEASGNIQDQTGNHHSTIIGGTPDYQQTGIVTYGINLDGVDEYFNIADDDQLSPLITTGFSISQWINIDSDKDQSLVSKYENPYEWCLWVWSDSSLTFRIYGANGNYIGRNTAAGEATAAGGWYNIVATYSGGVNCASMKIYINGVQKDTSDGTNGDINSPLNSTSPMMIGKQEARYLDGIIDETIIWQGKELTVDEISWLYSRGSPYRKGYQIK